MYLSIYKPGDILSSKLEQEAERESLAFSIPIWFTIIVHKCHPAHRRYPLLHTVTVHMTYLGKMGAIYVTRHKFVRAHTKISLFIGDCKSSMNTKLLKDALATDGTQLENSYGQGNPYLWWNHGGRLQ